MSYKTTSQSRRGGRPTDSRTCENLIQPFTGNDTVPVVKAGEDAILARGKWKGDRVTVLSVNGARTRCRAVTDGREFTVYRYELRPLPYAERRP